MTPPNFDGQRRPRERFTFVFSDCVEAILFATSANVKTLRRELRPGASMARDIDGAVVIYRTDGSDVCDGWRPLSRFGYVVARAIEYFHVANKAPFVHAFTPGTRMSFIPHDPASCASVIRLYRPGGEAMTHEFSVETD